MNFDIQKWKLKKNSLRIHFRIWNELYKFTTCSKFKVLIPSLTEKNYWADNSYYSELEVTIYGQ